MAKYLKPDSELGYIEDGVAIEFLKFNNLRHTVLGFMLGDFDGEGNYIVADEIKKELIAMPKHIIDSLENVEICQSYLKLDKPISFMVVYEGNKASLVLIEKLSFEANFKLNSGTYSNINEFVLDEVETSGEINRNVLYQRWNIGEFGGEEVDILSCGEEVLLKYFGLVARFKYLLEANSVLLTKEEELEEVEAEYANSMFDILKHYPKFEEGVKKQIKQTLSSKKQFFKVEQPNFSKTFNELLINAIESNVSVLNEQEKKEFNIEHRNALNVVNIKRKNVLELQKGQVQTRELSGLNVREVAKSYVEKINNFKQEKKSSQREKLITTLESAGIDLGRQKQETNLVAKAAEKNVEAQAESKAENKKAAAPVKKDTKSNAKPAAKKAGAKSSVPKESAKKEEKKTDDKNTNTNSSTTPQLTGNRKKRRSSNVLSAQATNGASAEGKNTSEVKLLGADLVARMAGRVDNLGVESNKGRVNVGGGHNNVSIATGKDDFTLENGV